MDAVFPAAIHGAAALRWNARNRAVGGGILFCDTTDVRCWGPLEAVSIYVALDGRIRIAPIFERMPLAGIVDPGGDDACPAF